MINTYIVDLRCDELQQLESDNDIT